MSTKQNIQRRALFNFMAAVAGFLLCLYVLDKWITLPVALKSGATGWTLLVVAIAIGLVATVYLFLAWLLRFRYRPNISQEHSKRLRVLHYSEQQTDNLVVIWHAAGLWVTDENNFAGPK